MARSVFRFLVKKSVGFSHFSTIQNKAEPNRNRTLIGRFLWRYLGQVIQMVDILKGSVYIRWYFGTTHVIVPRGKGYEPTREATRLMSRFIATSVGRFRSFIGVSMQIYTYIYALLERGQRIYFYIYFVYILYINSESSFCVPC